MDELLSELQDGLGPLDPEAQGFDPSVGQEDDAEAEVSGQPESQAGVGAPRQSQPTQALDPLEDQKRRNAGLQRRLQREIEQRRALEQKLREMEEAVLYHNLSHLPPQERAARIEAFRRERELADRERRLEAAEREAESRYKALVIAELSRLYGVDPQDLEPFDNPDEMEHFAKRMAQVRRQPPPARFEPGESVPAPRKRPKNLDEAAMAFRQAVLRRGIGL
jgi:hypothetical protein